jgi:predicted metal-dependent enzyme (double-stranded beta helix superfamily)
MLADTHNGVAPGCRELVEALDRAAAQPNVDDITRSIQELLSRMAVEGSIALPASLCDPCEDGYARRLIHLSESPLYSVLAMVWGPGQGTSVHDHSGMWCVEGVIEGQIEVTPYDMVERVADRCRFQAQESTSAGIGSSGRLIPPFDYHTIRNTGTEECAITIHVYGGEMVECNIFEPAADGWYEERAMQLAYTA